MSRPDELPAVGQPAETTSDALRVLHEAYTYKVNAALADRSTSVVSELTDAYLADSIALMVARE
ncbi:MAG: hypothetical protein QOK39_915 [Acidimicrobiaceae bacterium]|nr:hypothetical protein [Acidimicrobiaceae bacterium]MDQ1427439.1 hypothetical protein [Acidimicrobiaceae bacterium]